MNRVGMLILKNLHRIPYTAVRLFKFAGRPERYSKEKKYELIQYITETIKTTGNIEIRVFGRDNIPDESGFIFYPNHQGIFDGFAMVDACKKPFSPVIKAELMEIPIIKQIFICLESLAMDRSDLKQSMSVMKEVVQRVENHENCLIFPEGTRSRQGNRLLDFKGGSFKPAVKTKCPIIPVALIDSFKPFDQKGCEKVIVQIHILEPILYEEYQSMKTNKIAEEVKRRIEEVILFNTAET